MQYLNQLKNMSMIIYRFYCQSQVHSVILSLVHITKYTVQKSQNKIPSLLSFSSFCCQMTLSIRDKCPPGEGAMSVLLHSNFCGDVGLLPTSLCDSVLSAWRCAVVVCDRRLNKKLTSPGRFCLQPVM